MNTYINNLKVLKNGSVPFYASATSNLTDMDVFPYNRFFRGIPESDVPVIHNRMAGWKPRHDKCYNIPKVVDANSSDYYPNHCYQSAPSTTYPCYPEYVRKYSDKNELDIQLFNRNVLEYR